MTLRIGWIGCGIHATQMLLPQLLRYDVQIAALCDTNKKRLESSGRQFGVSLLYSDAIELLRNEHVDAIGMAVGPDQHFKLGRIALDHGLPVFMEKPPGRNIHDANELYLASKRSGKPLLLGFMKRYSIGNKIAYNIINDGGFGPVLGLSGYYMTSPSYFLNNTDYTNFFLHHCIHYMDLVSYLISPVVKITARKVTKVKGHILLHINFDFKCGAIGTIAMGTTQSRGTPVEHITIMGDHQRIEIENIVNITWHRDPGFKINSLGARLLNNDDTLTWKPNFTIAADEDFKGYHALLGEVISSFKGEPSSAPTIDDGVIAMKRLELLRKELNL